MVNWSPHLQTAVSDLVIWFFCWNYFLTSLKILESLSMFLGIYGEGNTIWLWCSVREGKLLKHSILLRLLQFFAVSSGKIILVVVFLTVFHYFSLQIRQFGALMCCLRKLSILRNLESFTTSNIQWQVAQGTFNTFTHLMSTTDSTVMISWFYLLICIPLFHLFLTTGTERPS